MAVHISGAEISPADQADAFRNCHYHLNGLQFEFVSLYDSIFSHNILVQRLFM